MIISFAWTVPALLAREKTVTRRAWNDRHAAKFHTGDLVDAYDRQPWLGGKKIATIRLTRDPYKMATLPADHWDREGFAYLSKLDPVPKVGGLTPSQLWESWERGTAANMWIVEFEVVSVEKDDETT